MALSTVKRFSLRRDGEEKITPNFKVKEFACHDGTDLVLVAPLTLDRLEKIRTYYRRLVNPGCTVVVNSGYRTPSWNRRVRGASKSQHVQGRAVDFTVRIPHGGIISPIRVYNDINEGRIFGAHHGGLGKYASFTHLDTGNERRWVGP
jgi:uncharacterized protein YcbK (DUF882 family)